MLRAQLETPVGQEEYNKHAMMNTTMGTTTEIEQEQERERRADVGVESMRLMGDKVHHTHICCGPTRVGNQMRCLALDLQARLGEIQWICDQLSYGGSHNRNDVGAGKGIRVIIFHWTQLVATT